MKEFWFEALESGSYEESVQVCCSDSKSESYDDSELSFKIPLILLNWLSPMMEKMFEVDMLEKNEKKLVLRFSDKTLIAFKYVSRKPDSQTIKLLEGYTLDDIVDLHAFLSLYELQIWIPPCLDLLKDKLWQCEYNKSTLDKVMEMATVHKLKDIMQMCLKILLYTVENWSK
jgi:hypothetical protein